MLDSVVVQRVLKPGEILILGRTHEGRLFRPSDWAERLAGVMAQFRHAAHAHQEEHLCYSPYCMPTLVDGVRSIVLSRALADIEPMAYAFVLNFARDNNLETAEACILDIASQPEAPSLDLEIIKASGLRAA